MVAGGVGRERMSGQVKVGGGEKRKREEREKNKIIKQKINKIK